MTATAARIVIIGANGAIGAALIDCYLQAQPEAQILACSRQPLVVAPNNISWHHFDVTDESSIAAAAAQSAAAGPLDRIIICTGLLHDAANAPEKSLQALDPVWLRQSFEVNTIGPALVFKHFLRLLRRDERAVCAALSARVGSISDNRLGGWYSYRAAKAALNMLIATAAIELRRSHPQALLIGLHPGTVDSALSAPFQGRLRPGQLQTPQQAAGKLRQVIETADVSTSGCCLAWDGSVIPP
jgi:NAD(P)-dependent dehydrogenase (short-subunit alcohol dehydrogenase family)